jgi:molecular chaperone DnaJ
MKKDYYQVLGIPKDASQDDIKKAFRKLAHEHHPDKKTGNADKFKEANEAYSVLSDDSKRQQYDAYGSAGPSIGGGQGGFGGFDFSGFQQGNAGFQDFDLGDIFGEFFGGGRSTGSRQAVRGRDISVDVEIPFSDSIFGTEQTIRLSKISTCDTCSGSGAKKGSEMKNCDTCNGRGKINETRRSIMGSFSTTRTCDVCHGAGKVPKEKCSDCHGQGAVKKESEIKVKIPAGIEDGETMRLSGGGEAVPHGTTGDLYIKIHVKKHAIWRKEGANLVTELNVKLTDALLGTEYDLVTLDGNIKLKIPEGVTHGEILRIKGKGVPVDKHRRGDILTVINITIPRKLSKDQKKLIEDLKKQGI